MQPHATPSLTASGLNLIAQGMTIYDHDLRLAVCNAPFQQMFDLPDALVTPGASFRETITHLAVRGEYGPIDDLDSFVQERVDQARNFEAHYMERTRANGRTISVEGSPLPQGGWVTVYTDISQTKAQEALLRAHASDLGQQVLDHAEALSATNRQLAATVTALEEAKRQLTRTEAHTRLTTEMMPAHLAHVNAEGRYTFSNRKLNAVMPGRPSDIVGMTIADALGDFAYGRIAPALTSAYQGEASVFEFTDNASARRIRGSFTPDGTGGAYIMSMDITEETQARVALQQTRRRTLAAQMTSGLAHDFSNLLTIILGLQSKLGRLPDLPEAATEMIEGTLAATRRGGALLNAIADMTAGRAMRPAATDIQTLLGDVQTLARSTLPDGLTLAVSPGPLSGAFLLDPGMVQDSLLNLILNARDACGTRGQITLTAQAVHDTWLEFIVTDSGPGFSSDALEHGCDPFFTTKGAEGSGLGLPMVYDMTKRAGGDLKLGNGTTGAHVRLRLPLRHAPDVSGRLVLLVEDDAALREHYRDMLIDTGHSVIEAAGVDEAIALTADLPDIALVLSDVNLGSGSRTGVDLALQLTGTVPVILMTSLPPQDPLFHAATQAAPVLNKPFEARDLLVLLRTQVAA
ncbi:PAS-domain containing protein [uncultured Tateyamaria sp.]|uniref:hybrid sensor histidine kinase/response regulator n=1 Tax=uncultured Tateyamaria sp. TaxID=455651 RepID=UPI00262EBAC8|nr:PAS-domain containing protein [uncultured Tateyamaria sp.]